MKKIDFCYAISSECEVDERLILIDLFIVIKRNGFIEKKRGYEIGTFCPSTFCPKDSKRKRPIFLTICVTAQK
jgi:hypothetical protein